MSAGGKSHKIVFQSLSETQDSTGGIEQSFSSAFTRWASLAGVTGAEKYIAGEMVGTVSHKIRVRYDSETRLINSGYRGLIGGRVFNIDAAINIREENREILILAKEIII